MAANDKPENKKPEDQKSGTDPAEAKKPGVEQAEEHETPYPTQAQLDEAKLARGRAAVPYATRDARKAD